MRPLGKPLTLADRVRVVAAMLPGMQSDIYAGKYSVPGRPNITTIQHMLFDDDVEEYRGEMEKILAADPKHDEAVCTVLWPD